jgi:chemotaxis family two-component system response regulator Rcp1
VADIQANRDTPLEVFLVEDSPGDARLTREAFRDANPAINLHLACVDSEAVPLLIPPQRGVA